MQKSCISDNCFENFSKEDNVLLEQPGFKVSFQTTNTRIEKYNRSKYFSRQKIQNERKFLQNGNVNFFMVSNL